MSNIYLPLVALLCPVVPAFKHLLVKIRGLDMMDKERLDWRKSLSAFYLSLAQQHVRTASVPRRALL